MITRVVKISLLFVLFILVSGISTHLTLTLIIKGEDSVIVPELVGKDVVSVLEVLTDMGLNTKVGGSEYSATVPKHHVIFQEPEPGTEIKKGRDIRIVISKGASTVLMPNLRGLSVHQARIILEENGLCDGLQTVTHNQLIRKDNVIAHSPGAGQMIPRKNCVDMLISAGPLPKAYKMPDVEGKSLSKTILVLEKMNLSLGEITSVYDPDIPRNTIITQEPLSGHRVAEGEPVRFIVNQRESEELGRFYSGSNETLFRYRTQSGFLNRRIRVQIKTIGFSNDLFDDFMKPNQEIWLLVPKNAKVDTLVYENEELLEVRSEE